MVGQKQIYTAYNSLTKEPTPIVIISGEFVF